MELYEIVRAMIFVIPLGIFTTLSVLVFFIVIMKAQRFEDYQKNVFFFYLACATLTSALFISYYYYPDFFRRVDFVYCGSLIFTFVLFHHGHTFTMASDKRLSPFHYIIPAIVFCALLAAKFFSPEYLTNRNYNILFYIILIFGTYYTIIGLYEMRRYYIRLSITYGSSKAINHPRVVLLVLEKLMYPTVFGLLPFIGGQHPGPVVSILLMLIILMALICNTPLLYTTIRYFTLYDLSLSMYETMQFRRPTADPQVVLLPNSNNTTLSSVQPVGPANTLPEHPVKRRYRKNAKIYRATGQMNEIERAVFERYFKKNKPYLNPYLTLEDLTEPLQTNRTYLSKFINRTYGMNFNNYLNVCRLHEMDRLLSMYGNRHKTPESLCTLAGFGSYRSYLKAKNNLSNNKNPDKS